MVLSWQELVFSFGSLLFAIALLPSVLDKDTEIPLFTSSATGITLITFSLSFLSLGMFYSAATNLLVSAMWIFIAIKRRIR